MSDNGGTAGVKLFNAGMRGRKGQVYDGGHRVPFFIHWPSGELDHGKDANDITSHIDVLPTLFELCGLDSEKNIDFDGRSFKQQLYDPLVELPERILFVEKQRTYKSESWMNTAGMTKRWRLINNKELYDIKKDPAQASNVFDQHPEIVEEIQQSYDKYWVKVTPKDREAPRFIVGHRDDPETYLTPSDWYLPKVPWNHAQVAKGSPEVGAWQIHIAKKGIYRFEVGRWPRETDAPIVGVPEFGKKNVDSWTSEGAVEKLIYGDEMKALAVQSIQLHVGELSQTMEVRPEDKQITFEVELGPGDTHVQATLLNQDGNVIAGAYYIYVSLMKDPK